MLSIDATELPVTMPRRARSIVRYFSVFPPSTAFRLIGLKLKLRKLRGGELIEFPVLDSVSLALRAKNS